MRIVTWCLGVGTSEQCGQSVLLASIPARSSKGPKALPKNTLLLLLLWQWGILPSILHSTFIFRSACISEGIGDKKFVSPRAQADAPKR